jgi:hypothetical protein
VLLTGHLPVRDDPSQLSNENRVRLHADLAIGAVVIVLG